MANLSKGILSSLFGTHTSPPTSLPPSVQADNLSRLMALRNRQFQNAFRTRAGLANLLTGPTPNVGGQTVTWVTGAGDGGRGTTRTAGGGGVGGSGIVWINTADFDEPTDHKNLPHETEFGEITAWRGWNINDGRLRSIYFDSMWPPGDIFKADGDPLTSSAGIYAHKTLDQLRDQEDVAVYGKVELWGEIVEHVNGYRAQFADIVELTEFRDDVSESDQLELREAYVRS